MILVPCCILIKNIAFENLAMQATAFKKLNGNSIYKKLHYVDSEKIILIKICCKLPCKGIYNEIT